MFCRVSGGSFVKQTPGGGARTADCELWFRRYTHSPLRLSQSLLPGLLLLLSGSLLLRSRSSLPECLWAKHSGQAGGPQGGLPPGCPSAHTEHFFFSFSGGLDPDPAPGPDPDRYLPAAVLAGLPGRSADPAVAIFPGESSLSGPLSQQTPPCRRRNQRGLAAARGEAGPDVSVLRPPGGDTRLRNTGSKERPIPPTRKKVNTHNNNGGAQ